jgi:hypothetical protein
MPLETITLKGGPKDGEQVDVSHSQERLEFVIPSPVRPLPAHGNVPPRATAGRKVVYTRSNNSLNVFVYQR